MAPPSLTCGLPQNIHQPQCCRRSCSLSGCNTWARQRCPMHGLPALHSLIDLSVAWSWISLPAWEQSHSTKAHDRSRNLCSAWRQSSYTAPLPVWHSLCIHTYRRPGKKTTGRVYHAPPRLHYRAVYVCVLHTILPCIASRQSLCSPVA